MENIDTSDISSRESLEKIVQEYTKISKNVNITKNFKA